MTLENLLLHLRKSINELDEKILIMLARRRALTIEMGKLKIKYKYPIRDVDRECDLIKHLIQLGKLYQLDDHYIVSLFKLIIRDSILLQQILFKYH